jgi:hypothetical protein
MAELLVAEINVSAGPVHILDIIQNKSIDLGWFTSRDDAREFAERHKRSVTQRLREELDELNRVGRFCPFAFNSSSDDHIQGSAFIEPKDLQDARGAKERMAHFSSYESCLQKLTARDFEAMCSGILSLMGVQDPKLTKATGDQGIDFYGKLQVGNRLVPATSFPGVEVQMEIWMIGQAKHYIEGQVSTPDIRELVGSVELARGRAFSTSNAPYPDLIIRVCDPVFFLFFTTGRISAQGWKLLTNSGVVGMDGGMVAALLAKSDVGVANGTFDANLLSDWVRTFLK